MHRRAPEEPRTRRKRADRGGFAAVALLLLACDTPPPNSASNTHGSPRPQVANADEPPGQESVGSAADTVPDQSGWGRAGGLRYLEVLRGNAKPSERVPMLVLVHGLGDRPTPAHVGESQRPLRVVLPQAPTPYHRGFSWFPFRAVTAPPEQIAPGIARAAAQLARAIDVLTELRPTRGRPILSGFSQGGMLAFALALHHPENIGLSLPVSGWLPKPLWPAAGPPPGQRQVPIRAVHGDADRVVPFAPTKAMVDRLQAQGYDVTLQRFAGVGHTKSSGMDEALSGLLEQTLDRLEK